MKRHTIRVRNIALSILMTGASSAALAEAADVDEVVVTGSRIRVVAEAQAVVSLDADAIGRQGLTSTVDVLQRLPAAGGGLNAKVNNAGNFGNPPDGGGVGAGSAEIDLRHLGARRTLVLVDGQRWVAGTAASGIPAAVDLNTIPNAMIARVEVLQRGASAVYGSDAIAGVVNIITKDRFEGFAVDAQVGETDHSDGRTQDYNVTWGVRRGGTQLVLGGGYLKQESILASERALSRFPSPYATACDASCSSFAPGGRFVFRDPNTGQDLSLTVKQPIPAGQRGTYTSADPTGAGSSFKTFTNADRFNFQPFNYLSTPLERVSLFGSLRQDLGANTSLRLRGSYVQRRSANQAAPSPIVIGPDAAGGTVFDTIGVDATNVFNPFGFSLQPGVLSVIGRRLIESGPRHFRQDVDTWNLSGTLAGSVAAFGRTWAWDANAAYSRGSAHQSFTGGLNGLRVQQALGPAALCTGDCVPLNLFGGPGSITPAMLAYIDLTQKDASRQDLFDLTANLAGDLIDLPAGPVAFAVGVERRRQSGAFRPDALAVAGIAAEGKLLPFSGAVTVKEAYGELRVPLLRDLPLVAALDADVAGRVFDYSSTGSGSTFQAGLSWRPVADVVIRGGYAEGFRSASLGELFGTESRFGQEVVDACSGFGAATPAQVRANCIAQGVPANGSYVQLNGQVSVTTGGNRNLRPETSESWTLGAAWQPAWLRDTAWSQQVSVELSYADLRLDGAIQAQDAQALLNRCAQAAEPLACAAISRTASGQVNTILNPIVNIGGIQTRTLDLAVTWASPDWAVGRFQARMGATRLLEFSERVPTATGLTTIRREGTERGSPDHVYPKTRANLTLDWDRGDFGATLAGRYISGADEVGVANRLSSRGYLDGQVRWTPRRLVDGLTVAGGVTNLTDKDPPACITCSLNNFDPNAYDIPGRFLYLRLSYRL